MFLGLRDTQGEEAGPGTEVLSNAQMREADRQTIENGVPGYDLMTAAGQAVANIVHERYPGHHVVVLCGPGNNGGDGFVAALFLEDLGHDITLFSLVPKRKYKGDARQALKEWGGQPLAFNQDTPAPEGPVVVIDALFGTGLSKPLGAPVADMFAAIKTQGWPIVAVDIPSGVDGDTGQADPQAPEAAHTVTFFRKKRGHVLMPGMAQCGQISVHDIGIDDAVLADTGFDLWDNDPALWRDRLPSPQGGGHKYSRGHIVVLGGEQMTGAARMVSEAAMRSGAGLCTIAAAQSAADVYKRAAAHVLYEPLDGGYEAFGKHLTDERRNVAVLGPGAGLDDRQGLRAAVSDVLAAGRAAVLDADALTCFAGEDVKAFYNTLHGRCVLTPHEGEFARLFLDLSGGKIERAQQAADRTGAVIVLKGPDTVIAMPGHKPVVNTHATPWLATAGAGDVLAGIIAGLMAQGMESFDAACAGAWLHGEAALRKGPGLVAPDIIEVLPTVLRDLA